MKYFFYSYAWIMGNLHKRFPKFRLFQQTSSTSIIIFDKSNNCVTKKVMLYEKHNVVKNEAYWLIKLSGFSGTPELISVENNCLTMTYAGKRVCTDNLPVDWELQMTDILLKLSEIKCSHNDIKPTDILVLNKKLMLIDFQWATEKGSSMPAGWPNYIGRTFKKSDKTYDDQFSFRKSIQWIIGNKTL